MSSPDNLERLPAGPTIRLEDDTPVPINPVNFVLLEFDDPVFDTADMHPVDGKKDRIRIPVRGTYLFVGEVEWEPNDEGYRVLQVVLLDRGDQYPNLGKSLAQPRDSAVQPTVQQVTAIARLDAGVTVGLVAGQGSQVRLEVVRCTFAAAFLSR